MSEAEDDALFERYVAILDRHGKSANLDHDEQLFVDTYTARRRTIQKLQQDAMVAAMRRPDVGNVAAISEFQRVAAVIRDLLA